jgi:gas vesicle protein
MELRRLLEESYRRQCHRALYNSREEFLAQLNNADAREEDFSEAISAIKQAYSERFQKPYQDEKDQVIANVKQIAERMQKKEADLMQDLARMSESLTKTAEDREELMHQISNPEVPSPPGGQDPVDVDQ